ncbi:MAG TPA: hypothetical protein VFU13_02540 [Steroidobacteraceae bacterium]|nr:hypothetical protein [Steroidobacteraceae bacterium]
MKNSNLAARLEEFATVINLIEAAESRVPPVLAVVPQRPRRTPPRLSLTTRRILIRDQGLRPFRVF